MSLKIIGAGFGRTGTMSTYTALKELGYPCYHMAEVIMNKANKSHIDFWNKVTGDAPGAEQDWDIVFKNYTATVDNPGCCVWKELSAAYPDAKVILTLHPKGAEAWYQSTMDTIYFTENLWQFKVMQAVIPFMRKFGNMSKKLIWQRSMKGAMPNKDAAIARYNEHIEEVKATIPPEKLLVFSVSQGWEPLCTFLNVAVPATPFPNVNDKKEFQKIKKNFTKGAYVILAVAAIILVLIALVAVKFLK
jgi:hypothetical protein